MLLFAASLAGCLDLGATGSESEPEGGKSSASLGRYDVTAKLDTQTCGVGTLKFPETLTFLIDLDKHGDNELSWGDGALSLRGKLHSDGTGFSVGAESVVDARAGSENTTLPPCRIERADKVEGELDKAEDPSGFEAELEIHYGPQAGSDCRDLLFGPDRLVQALPCEARYVLEGERTE